MSPGGWSVFPSFQALIDELIGWAGVMALVVALGVSGYAMATGCRRLWLWRRGRLERHRYAVRGIGDIEQFLSSR